MKGKYRGLIFVSVFLKIAAVVVVIVGIGIGLFSLVISGSADVWDRAICIGFIVAGLTFGAIVYAVSELIGLMLDIKDDIDNKVK